MPWNRNDPDPIKIKRRQLAEQERLLAEQMSRLNEELHQSGQPLAPDPKTTEPPVWRMEDNPAPRRRLPEPASTRVLARHRQRDMLLFFLFIGLLLIALVITVLVYYTHYAPATTGP